MEITATEFKAKCLKLLDQVNQTGETLEISKHGKPVARLIPIHKEAPWIKLRGKGHFKGDAFAPVIEASEIQALK
ncbi:MAG: type II toxin-antitoxin system Phd/YefM family antitoxin [Lentimonas sp.]